MIYGVCLHVNPETPSKASKTTLKAKLTMNTKPKTLTKTEFADLCGVGLDYISVNITRKKIICNNKGRIDPSNELNALFIERRINKTDTKKISLIELERALKESELNKRNKEIELLTLKKQKLDAELIPVELVKSIFLYHNHSIVTAFKECAETYTNSFAHRARLSLEDRAALRGSLVEGINNAITNAQKLSHIQVDNICREYSLKRGQGEKK